MGEDSGFFGLDMGDGSTLSCNVQVYACGLGGRSKVCVPLNNSSTLFSMFFGVSSKTSYSVLFMNMNDKEDNVSCVYWEEKDILRSGIFFSLWN
jgi:hypothetical protein